jgi:hypothetical protein
MSTQTTNLLQITFCLKGLELEKRTGLRMSRISARDCAKSILGYKTNQKPSYDVLITKMTDLKQQAEQLTKVGTDIVKILTK